MMYQQLSTPPGAPLTWSQAWTQAITKPSEETYVAIASDPSASSGRALTWVFVASIISYIIAFVLQILVFGALGSSSLQGNQFGTVSAGSLMGASLGSLICGLPIAAVFGIVGFIIFTGITNLVAKALGGTGSFDQLLYATAAYAAPLSIISSVISAIPVVNCISVVLGIYGIVLNVVAVKAVHQFGWGKAIASSIVIWVLVIVFVAVVTIVILALLGPAIGNIFSNIVQTL